MRWRNRIVGRFGNKPVPVRRPDHEQRRQGSHLFIWRDIPHWMIVDHEFRLEAGGDRVNAELQTGQITSMPITRFVWSQYDDRPFRIAPPGS